MFLVWNFKILDIHSPLKKCNLPELDGKVFLDDDGVKEYQSIID